MSGIFEQATAVRRIDETRFGATVQPGWDIGGNANGGYLLAIAGRAMAEASGRDPLTLTAHFLRPAPAGPCHVEVEIVRSGRQLATMRAGLWQGDRQILELLGTFGASTDADDAPAYVDGAPPELPPWDDAALPERPPGTVGPSMFEQLGIRFRPDDIGFRTGETSGRAEIAGWFSFADERPVDPVGLLFVADSFPPPIFNTDVPAAWVPTIELTVHVRGVPAPGPLRCVFRSRFIHGGLADEDGEVWDSRGRLIAQSRQISLTPRPPAV